MSEGYQGFMSDSQGTWLSGNQGVQGNQGVESPVNPNALLYQQLKMQQDQAKGFATPVTIEGFQSYGPQGNQTLAYVADSQGNQGFVTSDTQGNQVTVFALAYQGFQANGGLLVGGGVQGVQSVTNNFSSGGLLIGGQPYTTTPLRADSSGDLLVGGSGNEVITFRQIQCESNNCGCEVLDFNITGGLSIKATTTVTQLRSVPILQDPQSRTAVVHHCELNCTED